jgi:hypothetical protein
MVAHTKYKQISFYFFVSSYFYLLNKIILFFSLRFYAIYAIFLIGYTNPDAAFFSCWRGSSVMQGL